MSEDKKELEWWEKTTADPEAIQDIETLKQRMQNMSAAGAKLSTRYMTRLFSVTGLIIFNAYIMYMSYGGPQMTFTYIYCVINILVGFDALNSARKLRSIAAGNKVIFQSVKPKLPKFCGNCGETLEYLPEPTK